MTQARPGAGGARAADGAPVQQGVEIVKDVQGREVLTAYAPVLPLGWLMFVELPIEEAYAPLYEAIKRSATCCSAA